MKKAILTTKVGMTQIFNEDGVLVPVTVLQAGPCVVTQVKTCLLYTSTSETVPRMLSRVDGAYYGKILICAPLFR